VRQLLTESVLLLGSGGLGRRECAEEVESRGVAPRQQERIASS
jgi:hypothetical protein